MIVWTPAVGPSNDSGLAESGPQACLAVVRLNDAHLAVAARLACVQGARDIQTPQGLLEVQVLEACHVPSMDWIGKSEPFIKWATLLILIHRVVWSTLVVHSMQLDSCVLASSWIIYP